MTEGAETIARESLAAAEADRLPFPEIVARLMAAGFEGYGVDFRLGSATYYPAGGGGVVLPTHRRAVPIADRFDADRVRAAIREAQLQAPGYSYLGFCEKVMAAGCAGYIVSFPGRRVLYFGRTAEIHIEHFPQ